MYNPYTHCTYTVMSNNNILLYRTSGHHSTMAAYLGHSDCVALLAASGANVNMKDDVS